MSQRICSISFLLHAGIRKCAGAGNVIERPQRVLLTTPGQRQRHITLVPRPRSGGGGATGESRSGFASGKRLADTGKAVGCFKSADPRSNPVRKRPPESGAAQFFFFGGRSGGPPFGPANTQPRITNPSPMLPSDTTQKRRTLLGFKPCARFMPKRLAMAVRGKNNAAKMFSR